MPARNPNVAYYRTVDFASSRCKHFVTLFNVIYSHEWLFLVSTMAAVDMYYWLFGVKSF